MTDPRSLKDILAELHRIEPGDTEANHSRADDLLREAFQRAMTYAHATIDQGYADIVEAYDAIGKWYA